MTVTLALLSWPLVTIWLLRTKSTAAGVSWAMLGAYLLLPAGKSFDLPVLPALGKNSIPSLTIILFAASFAAYKVRQARFNGGPQDTFILPGWFPKSPVILVLMGMMVFGGLATGLTNGDSLSYGPKRLPGMGTYDAFSLALTGAIGLLPILIGRKFLAHPETHRIYLMIFFIAAMLYTIPTLYEARMSPQINRMVYGFFPHEWRQHIRGGAFRPVVFLEHGLRLGIFLCMAALAAVALFRDTTDSSRTRFLLAAGYLAFVLLVSRNLGAVMIFLALSPLVLLSNVRVQLMSAAIVGALVITYPVLRGNNLISFDPVINIAKSISPERAGSLQFRLDNEDMLLKKASQRPAFGWGGWGRDRVFDERGRDLTTVDGRWIISISQGGWTRYLAEFGLLTVPLFVFAFRRRTYAITFATSGLCLMHAANLIDLLPNSSFVLPTGLLAGALIGRMELGRLAETTPEAQTPHTASPRPNRYGARAAPPLAYSRFPVK